MTKFLFTLLLLSFYNLHSQCTTKISHLSGSQIIDGIQVEVTSTGFASSYTYCSNEPEYYLGAAYVNGGQISSADGSYTFHFSPAINSATLNIFGMDNIIDGTDHHEEEAEILVNGLHYPFPQLFPNPCTPMAIVNSSGNLGCTLSQGLYSSGCGANGIAVNGIINTLTVYNHYISGNPSGWLFSIFICSNLKKDEFSTDREFSIFPNPVNSEFTIQSSKSFNDASMNIFNIQGILVDKVTNINDLKNTVNCESLKKGMYFIEIYEEKRIVFRGKIVK